jgi:hypothetical protein
LQLLLPASNKTRGDPGGVSFFRIKGMCSSGCLVGVKLSNGARKFLKSPPEPARAIIMLCATVLDLQRLFFSDHPSLSWQVFNTSARCQKMQPDKIVRCRSYWVSPLGGAANLTLAKLFSNRVTLLRCG